MRLICLVSATGTVCATQNTNRSLPDVQRNVKGIPCVYFETLSSDCELPKRRELGLKGRDGRLKLVNSGAERREWRHKIGFIFELSLRTDDTEPSCVRFASTGKRPGFRESLLPEKLKSELDLTRGGRRARDLARCGVRLRII